MRKFRIPLLSILTFLSIFAIASANNLKDSFKSEIYRNKDGIAERFSILEQNPQKANTFSINFIERVSEENYVKGKLHIKFKESYMLNSSMRFQGVSAFNQSLDELQVTKVAPLFSKEDVKKYPQMELSGLDKIYEISIPMDKDPFEASAELMKNPEIAYACPVYVRFTNDFVPNDPRVSTQYALEQLNMFKAWEISKGSSDVLIGIVDSGTNFNHPDLTANLWTNPEEVPNNGVDDDGNGKVDDVHGWDFVGTTDINRFDAGYYDEDNDPRNTVNTHGTSVAGCAAATTNNSLSVASTGFNCKYVPVKCGSNFSNRTGIYRGYEAMVYAAELGADIINCSWGGYGYSASERDMMNYIIYQRNCLVVCAASNDSKDNDIYDYYPANYDGVLSVGATNEQSEAAYFSNYGYIVDVFAPGDEVYSTKGTSGEEKVSGTSFSSPLVAGIAGLIKSIHPNWTPAQIASQLRSTCKQVIVSKEGNEQYFGIVDAYKALEYNYQDNNKTIPGLEVISYEFTDNGTAYLNNYSKRSIKFTITNYLASAENIQVSVESIDNYAELENNTTNFGIINTGAERDININVTLTDANPWFNGYLRLVVRFEGAGYSNYQLVKIPIKVISTNTWSRDESSLSSIKPKFTDAVAYSSTGAWYALNTAYSTYGAAYIKQTGADQYEMGSIDASNTSCIAATSSARAAIGVYYNTTAGIFFTNNSGASWSQKSIPGGYVFGMAFFGDQEGAFLSNPSDGTWTVRLTTTAWDNLEDIAASPAAATGEKSHQNAFSTYDYSVWFGSNLGKVYYSYDKGYNWNSVQLDFAKNIEHLIFVDNLNGAIIYQKNGETSNQRLAVSTNGGASWTDAGVDFSKSYPKIVSTFSLFNSGIFYFVCEDGTIFGINPKDMSKQMILNTRDRKIQVAAAFASSPDLGTVLMANDDISKLTFKYEILNAKREILCLDGKLIDYDTLELTKNKSKFIKLKNIGNVTVTIDSIRIVPGNNTSETEFTLIGSVPASIDASSSASIRAKFMPETIGEKTAELIVYNNGEPSQYVITLTGFAKALPNEHKITFADQTQALIGEVPVGEPVIKKLTIANLSSLEIQIDSITFTPYSSTLQEEFSVPADYKKVFAPIEVADLNITVDAKSAGKKSSLIKIYNTGELNPIQILLDATAKIKADVNEISKGIKIFPQPANEELNIAFEEKNLPNSIELVDINGKAVFSASVTDHNSMKISTKNFTAGQYMVLLKYNNYSEFYNIIIYK